MGQKRSIPDESLRIALEVMEKVIGSHGSSSPSMVSMARDMKVDIHKVSHALHLLREYGYVQFSRGRGVHLGPKFADQNHATTTRHQTAAPAKPLYEYLRNRIFFGKIKTGEALPKRSFFALEWGASRETVGKIYARLTEEELIHRKGRRWYVGRPRATHFTDNEKLPFVLLVQPWSGYRRRYNVQRNWKFMYTFNEEATRAGLRIQPFTARLDKMHPVVPSGMENLRNFIEKNESPCLGVLILGRSDEYDDFFGMIHLLLDLKRPVVWFNYAESPNPLRITHRRLYVCTVSEDAFSGEALRFLARFGHEKVGYVSYFVGNGWQTDRLAQLRSRAVRSSPRIEVVSFFDAYDRLFSSGKEKTSARIERLVEHGPQTVQTMLTSAFDRIRKQLREPLTQRKCSRILTDYLFEWPLVMIDENVTNFPLLPRELAVFFVYDDFTTQPPPTALVLPSDRLALNTYPHLVRLGLRVPEALSVISYDNYFDTTVLPVTTIDLGLDNLGYRAFHAILQDIPVVSGTEGNMITAKPRVDRRGTVGFAPGRTKSF